MDDDFDHDDDDFHDDEDDLTENEITEDENEDEGHTEDEADKNEDKEDEKEDESLLDNKLVQTAGLGLAMGGLMSYMQVSNQKKMKQAEKAQMDQVKAEASNSKSKK